MLFRSYLDSKFSWVTLGKHPLMTVHDAVATAHNMQAKRNAGINPNKEKLELIAKNIQFRTFVNEYISIDNKVNNNYAKSTKEYSKYIINIILNKLGDYRINDITSNIIFEKLIKDYINENKLAMANRFRIKLKQIFDSALKKELITKNPAYSLDSYHKPKDSQNRNLHLTKETLKEFINDLYSANIYPNIKYYIHLMIILGVRKSELTHTTWEMIDFENKIFNNYQIKTKKLNKIPLSPQALKILSILKRHSKSKYIVTGMNLIGKDKPVGHSYFNKVLDNLEFNKTRIRKDRISPHDFRRVLSTLANESELFAPIDIEMVLGHETRSGVEKHYNNNATYLNRKREVLDWIANLVDELIIKINVKDIK